MNQIISNKLMKVSVGLLKNGTLRDRLGMSIEIASGDLTQEKLIQDMETVVMTPMPRSGKLVRISGDYTKTANVEFITRCLATYGFEISVVLRPEDGMPSWAAQVPWRILATGDPFVAIDINELWYSPKGDLAEPHLPPLKHPIFTFLDKTQSRSLDEISAFFMASPLSWSLL